MKISLLLTSMVLAAPVTAGEKPFSPPPGCKGFLTVQTKDCRVEHHWTCEGEPDGTQWIMVMDAKGPNFLQQVDREFGWLQSFDLGGTDRRELRRPVRDMNSLTTLLNTGYDHYHFEQDVLRNNTPFATETIIGRDRLTGDQEVIDGEPLQVIDYAYEEVSSADPQVLKSYGTQYVSARFRSFFLGRGTDANSTGKDAYDASPVRFIEPGEAGFFTTTPQYGCREIMSGLTQHPTLTPTPNKENNNDI